MKIAKDANVRVIFDLDVSPGFFLQQANLGTQEELVAALKLVDVLKPCKAAAKEMTGERDFDRMAGKLLDLGPKLVAVTMGPEGCLRSPTREKNRSCPRIQSEDGGIQPAPAMHSWAASRMDSCRVGDIQKVGLFRQRLRRSLLHASRRSRNVQARRCDCLYQGEQPGQGAPSF